MYYSMQHQIISLNRAQIKLNINYKKKAFISFCVNLNLLRYLKYLVRIAQEDYSTHIYIYIYISLPFARKIFDSFTLHLIRLLYLRRNILLTLKK